MRMKWIPIGMAVGLLVAALTGNVVLASGGSPDRDNGNANVEVIVEGQDELTGRVAEILGTDPQATAEAFAQVDAALDAEYVEAMLRGAVESGRITAEQADAIRSQVQSGDYSGLDRLWLDSFGDEDGEAGWFEEPEISHQEYSNRVGAILNVDGQRVADAIDRAFGEMYIADTGEATGEVEDELAEAQDELPGRVAEILGTDPQATAEAFAQVDAALDAEYVEAMLRGAVENGRITAEQADAIRSQVQSGDYSGLDQLWLDGLEDEGDAVIWFEEPEISHQEYSNRVGAILNVDGQRVADAIDQAFGEMYPEDLDNWEDGDDEGSAEEAPTEPVAAGAAAA